MSHFVLHPEAYDNLSEIWDYIALDNREAADRTIEEIHRAILSIVKFPHQGHSRPELTSRSLHFYLVRNYVIAYASDDTPIPIIAVLRARRNSHVLAAILLSVAESARPHLI